MFSVDEYRAIYAAFPDGCLVVTDEGVIRSANARIEELFGWSPEEIVGQRVEVLIPEALHEVHRGHRDRFFAAPHRRPMGAGLELRGQRKDGSTFPVEVSLSPWRQPDDRLSIICAIRDTTAYRRLKDFSEGALLASEDERKRIARELHDDTGQRLATLILSVRRLAGTDDPEQRAAIFEDVRAQIVDAAEGVRRMSRGLRPPEIEELGLSHAVHAHLRSLQESIGFHVEAELEAIDEHLDETAKLALYRIIQEALSNARRHSGAEGARVTIQRTEGGIMAQVEDSGSGFVLPIGETDPSGLGLLGMNERAVMIGGRLSIDSSPGAGTRVRVVIPVSEYEHA